MSDIIENISKKWSREKDYYNFIFTNGDDITLILYCDYDNLADAIRKKNGLEKNDFKYKDKITVNI